MKVTPMMQQYNEMKEKYSDALLFFRMGDFYEMFGEDAKIASRELEIVLTSRDSSKMPLCGVPYHALSGYLAKLIAKGYKVAICEQIEDPKLAKGLVKRDVVRIVTPGTVVDDNMLQGSAANYLAAVCRDGIGYALAYCDISTGEFMAGAVGGANARARLSDELARIRPRELLLPRDLLNDHFFALHAWDIDGQVALTPCGDEPFLRRNAATLLMTHFKVASVDALGLAGLPACTLACATVLNFILETQKRSLAHINHLQVYAMDKFMLLDAGTRRNLEITATLRGGRKDGSLLGVCDNTCCALGARLLAQWLERPLLDTGMVNLRLNAIANLLEFPQLLATVRQTLKGIYDLERLIGRIGYGNASPRDLLALRQSALLLPDVERLLGNLNAPFFGSLYEQMDTLADIAALIGEAISAEAPLALKDGGIIRDGYNAEIDELRGLTHQGKDWLLKMEAQEREQTGIKSLKVGFNKVFGYYIEVSKSYVEQVPDSYIRKQTLANGERYITPQLKEWESKILGASDKLAALEYELFGQLREHIATQTTRIQRAAACVAQLDAIQSLATLAAQNDYCKPIVDDGDVIEIRAGRHAVVEQSRGREDYVPNDAYFDSGENCFALITGPNMSGKSTYMRQVALCVLLARIGSYVPANSARVGYVDRIFTRVGASDDLAAGQSTFMVEMCETANILHNATRNSLVILDEIGRGTSTYDGVSIAWAVSEYILQKIGAKTLFATHYHELLALADNYAGVKNFSVAVVEKGENIAFLHKIVAGGTDRSYGIHVARLAGLPEAVLRRSTEILAQFAEEKHGTPQISASLLAEVTVPPKSAGEVILEELGDLDLNGLSPLDALLKLDQWQHKLQ